MCRAIMLAHRSLGSKAEVILLRAFGSRKRRLGDRRYVSALDCIPQDPFGKGEA